jgi:hypothetical protein
MQCFRSFHTAERAIEGVESLHMMRKGQVKRLNGRDASGQAKFVEALFGVAASRSAPPSLFSPPNYSCNTTLHMMHKGQVKKLDGRDSAGQAKFVASLFDVAA